MSMKQMKPSKLIHKASPRIASLLSSYDTGGVRANKAIGGQLTPSGKGHLVSGGSGASSFEKTLSIELMNELREWQTPGDMPILTSRQLEMSLVEIQRRKEKRLRLNHEDEEKSTKATTKEAAILVPICAVEGTPSILFTRRSSNLTTHASEISFPGGNYDEALDSIIIPPWKNRLINTALREMQEELLYDIATMGLDAHANYLHNNDEDDYYYDECKDASLITNQKKRKKEPLITILGQTQPVPSLHGTRVTPIIGAINYDLPNCTSTEFTALFPGSPSEVDFIFTIPLEYLLDNETSAPLQRWNNYDGKAEAMGPVFAIPDDYTEKNEGDRIWGFTAIILRALLRKVFRPVFGQDGLKVI